MILKELLKELYFDTNIVLWDEYDTDEEGPSFKGYASDVPWKLIEAKIGWSDDLEEPIELFVNEETGQPFLHIKISIGK